MKSNTRGMKNIRMIGAVLFILAIYGCNSTNSQPVSELLTVDEFEKKMKSTKDAILLDLRTDNEVANGMIAGAKQMDFNSGEFSRNLPKLDKSKKYMVYCAGGGRSGKAAKLMLDAGFAEVYDLKGGMGAWVSAGKGVEAKKE